jgi:hypothetical protein
MVFPRKAGLDHLYLTRRHAGIFRTSAISSAPRGSRTRRRCAFFRRNIMFQLANVPSSRPLTIFGPHPLDRTAASTFMVCSITIRCLSQAISGHGAYISQVNRLIFVNNNFYFSKRVGVSPLVPSAALGLSALARKRPVARALIGGKLTKKNAQPPTAPLRIMGDSAKLAFADAACRRRSPALPRSWSRTDRGRSAISQ